MTLSALPSQSANNAPGALRVLTGADLPALQELLATNADIHCVVAERVEMGVFSSGAIAGQIWGWYRGPDLISALYVGANLIPVETNDAARAGFAARLARVGRRSSAIVGDRGEVLDLWSRVQNRWGPAREVRGDQPFMVIDHESAISPDQSVRRVKPAEIDVLMPASVAMFEEEVGVSPVSGGREPAYRARLAMTIRQGRAYARISGGEVLFKAEVGSVSAGACQVQGVWVAPGLRGTAMAAPGIAAVVRAALTDHAPSVTLYANAHNTAALRSYARVGFRQTGTFATVLF